MFSALQIAWTFGKGFIAKYRTRFIVGFVGVLSAAIVGHLALDRIRNNERIELKSKLEQAQIDQVAITALAVDMTERIKAANARQLADIAASVERLERAQEAAAEVRIHRDQVTEEIGVLRFEILEAIQNDEDYADFAFVVVPGIGWEQLRDAKEGRAAD